TATVMPTAAPGWFPLRWPAAARAWPPWTGPGRGRHRASRAAPRPPRKAAEHAGDRAAADRWRPHYRWCSSGLTTVPASLHGPGGCGVTCEISHHLLIGEHHRAGTIGGAAMPGQHHPGVGDHVQGELTEAVAHQKPPPGVTRWHRIAVAAKRNSRLIAHRAPHFQHRWVVGRHRA